MTETFFQKKIKERLELTRKRTIEALFKKLETSQDRAMLLLLVQSYKDEIETLNDKL